MLVMVLGFVVGDLLLGCTTKQTDRAVVTAAQIVDQVAMRGDQVDAVTVVACNAAEEHAAEIADIEEADRRVQEIRVYCDQAFDAIDDLDEAIKAVDVLMGRHEKGEVPISEVVEAAVQARLVFVKAVEVHDSLRRYLSALKEKHGL